MNPSTPKEPDAPEPDAAGDQTGDKSAEELAADNAQLRSDLAAQNASLKEQLEASRAENPQQGLTDEDVRRAEHPEEFASTAKR